MPVRHITGKQVTVTYGTLDASAQITSVAPERASNSEIIQTLGSSVTTAGDKEISITIELLFDPEEGGASALFHAAYVDGGTVGLEIDYGGALSTYTGVTVISIGEAIAAEGAVTQSVGLQTGEPDSITWLPPTP